MSDSDDSYVSSTYGSDREILTSLAKMQEHTGSSDDSEDLLPACPTDSVGDAAQTEIIGIISSELVQHGFQIFPFIVREHLRRTHGYIVERLRNLPGRDIAVVIAGGSLLSLIPESTKKRYPPKTVLCDVCVFSPSQPVLVVTITSGSDEKDNIRMYNSELTRCIVQSVRRKTKYCLNVVNGVIEKGLCHEQGKFQEKITQLEWDAHVKSIAPGLVVTKSKCMNIIKPILQLFGCGGPDDNSKASGGEEANYVPTSCPENFQLQLRAVQVRMKQLEQAQAESEREKEIMKTQCVHVLEEVEKIKQEYLTDTRLSLLMRPCSSVGNESVSGYASTEVDDIPYNREVGAKNRTAEKEEDLSKLQSGLTREDIRTGDIGLIQYNRVITLHQASEEGKLDVVQYILSQGLADINSRGKSGRTPVMAAAEKAQMAVFEGCDLSAIDDDNNNVLHVAALCGNADIVRKLIIGEKYDINSTGRFGRTALMKVAYSGNKDVFDILVNHGCKLTTVDDHKNNILHMACMGGQTQMVQYILSKGHISIDSRGHLGRTPVMLAAEFGHKEVFELLVGKRCNLAAVDINKDNILHMACYSGHIDMVKYILSRHIFGIDSRGYIGRTPMMSAAVKGHRALFELLLRKGSNDTEVDLENNNILHVACAGGSVDMVKYLMNRKDLKGMEKVKNVHGRTPVKVAESKGYATVVSLFQGNG